MVSAAVTHAFFTSHKHSDINDRRDHNCKSNPGNHLLRVHMHAEQVVFMCLNAVNQRAGCKGSKKACYAGSCLADCQGVGAFLHRNIFKYKVD